MTIERSGFCVTGKVRYADANVASRSLARVRADREENPDGLPPECAYYECVHCDGWHLTSKPPVPDPPVKGDGEPWEAYAHRLEARVREQRDSITHLIELRHRNGDKKARRQIHDLRYALGITAEKLERVRRDRQALLDRLGIPHEPPPPPRPAEPTLAPGYVEGSGLRRFWNGLHG